MMPYLEESDCASDNVFLDTETSLDPHASPSQHTTQSPTPTDSTVASSPSESPVQLPEPRRSTRSTWGAPPVHYGKVITPSFIVSKMAKTPAYRQTLFVSCMPNIVLTYFYIYVHIYSYNL